MFIHSLPVLAIVTHDFLNGPIPASFCLFFSFSDYNLNNTYKFKKAFMVCLGFEPVAAGW